MKQHQLYACFLLCLVGHATNGQKSFRIGEMLNEEKLSSEEVHNLKKLLEQRMYMSSREDSSPKYDKNRVRIEEDNDCIEYIKVVAQTGEQESASQDLKYGANPQLVIQSGNDYYYKELPGRKESGREMVFELTRNKFSPNLPDCITKSDIKGVHIQAPSGGTDGWYVASIATYVRSFNEPYAQITSDPSFHKWVDYDEQSARLVSLSLMAEISQNGDCLGQLKISASTGARGFSSNPPKSRISLKLKDGRSVSAELIGRARANRNYIVTFSITAAFNVASQFCILQSDIVQVSLVYQGGDPWDINEITTSVVTTSGVENALTNSDSNKELSSSNTEVILSLRGTRIIDTPNCGFGIPVCECNSEAEECVFNFEIDELRTFTSYQKTTLGGDTGLVIRRAEGVLFKINEDGEIEPLQQHRSRPCGEDFNLNKCSAPQFADGLAYKLIMAVNGQVPGPTIIVHDQQMITIHVKNNLTAEGISVHWHGIHQADTPWMDGVGGISQCHIAPGSTFSYIYRASPSGSFWYHSHSGAQRTDGFFGTLIVLERPERLDNIKQLLGRGDFVDRPDKHSLSLLDWQGEASIDLFTVSHGGLGFYPGHPTDELPPEEDPYEITFGYDNGGAGPIPYWSGLINGKGRHKEVDYVKTRLSVFPVKLGESYRFRLIGAQGVFAYRFSIDGHKLTVVNTDGYWLQPTIPVDYIIIHTGERYDFILNADQEPKNYWMRGETLEVEGGGENLEVDPNRRAPFKSLGNVAEAILQYTDDIDDPPEIPSTEYQCIKSNSPPIMCTPTAKCGAVNCPFKNFHPSYNIDCINVGDLRLLEPTPSNQLPDSVPDPDCEDCLHFFNFHFDGDAFLSSVNGRSFLLPPAPPQTQPDDFNEQSIICDPKADCTPFDPEACACTYMASISRFNTTIQFVLSAIGAVQDPHPIHLHGHTFHVAYVGYPGYDDKTGFVIRNQSSQDIFCGNDCAPFPPICACDNPAIDRCQCNEPQWNPDSTPNIQIDEYTVRKDTVMMPAGGYVVINFRSDNPGYWIMHCHIELHQLEGMALIVNEVFDRQLDAPEGMNRCGDFTESVADFKARLSLPDQLEVAAAK